MAPVGSDGFRLNEGEEEGDADLRRVQRRLVLQVSEAGRLLWVGGAPVAADSMPRQWCQGRGQLAVSSLSVCVVRRVAPYIILCRSFCGKTQ